MADSADPVVSNYIPAAVSTTGPDRTYDTGVLSGQLAVRDGCLVLRTGSGDYAVVLERGSYEIESGGLVLAGTTFALGRNVVATGSQTGGPAAQAIAIPDACAALPRFVVSPEGLAKAGG